jgi:hypothetical protein
VLTVAKLLTDVELEPDIAVVELLSHEKRPITCALVVIEARIMIRKGTIFFHRDIFTYLPDKPTHATASIH